MITHSSFNCSKSSWRLVLDKACLSNLLQELTLEFIQGNLVLPVPLDRTHYVVHFSGG